MAKQKERFMTNGEFTDGPCGSPFCKGGCRDVQSSGVGFNLFAIWERAFAEYPDDHERARLRARELYATETGSPVAQPGGVEENEFAARAVFRRTIDAEVATEYL